MAGPLYLEGVSATEAVHTLQQRLGLVAEPPRSVPRFGGGPVVTWQCRGLAVARGVSIVVTLVGPEDLRIERIMACVGVVPARPLDELAARILGVVVSLAYEGRVIDPVRKWLAANLASPRRERLFGGARLILAKVDDSYTLEVRAPGFVAVSPRN